MREEDAKDFNIRFLRILLRIEKYFFSLVLKVTTVLRNGKEGFRLERANKQRRLKLPMIRQHKKNLADFSSGFLFPK